MDLTGSVSEVLRALLSRATKLVEMGPESGWQLDRDILKNDIWDFCERTFLEGSREYQIIDNALHPRSFSIYGTEWQNFYANFGEPVPRALELILHRVEQGQAAHQLAQPDEYLIGAGTPHAAYVLLRDIVCSASAQILVVDPYVDGSLLSLLTNAAAGVSARVLTRETNLPKDFREELKRFRQENALAMDVRCGLSDLHDRFLVADDHLFFSGASFKDLGKKGSVVAEITDIKKQTIEFLENVWAGSTPLA